MKLLNGLVSSMICRGMLPCMLLAFSFGVRADIYKCTKGGAVAYQETPCTGAHVKMTHIEARSSAYFEGCFSTAETRYTRSFDVQPDGAGTYRLIDERNPLGTAMTLKQATHDELLAVGSGLHMKISDGLSRYVGPPRGVNAYSPRYGYGYARQTQAISPASLYGLYRGTGAAGQPVTIFYSGGTPQVMVKTTCPRF